MIERSSARVAALLLVTAAGLGCSGSGSNALCDGGACGLSGLGPACDGRCWQPTADDTAFAEDVCALTADCCAQLRGASSPVKTSAEHTQWCSAALLEAGFSRDATLRAACLGEITQARGTAACMPEFWPPNPSAACGRLLAETDGPAAIGQRCKGQGDCQGKTGSLAECALGPDALAYCNLVSPGKAGDPCIASVNELFYDPELTTERTGRYCSSTDGLLCRRRDSSSMATFCVPSFADGSDCYRGYECASGTCLPPPSGSGLPAGTCATRSAPYDLPNGAACSSGGSCKSTHCTNGQCQSVPQYAGYELLCAW